MRADDTDTSPPINRHAIAGAEYYDKRGHPIGIADWGMLRAQGERKNAALPEYKRVGRDELGDKVMVSTVWLGMDHSFGMGTELAIFETMVFGGPMDNECERYATEVEALEGHARWVAKVRGET